MTSRITVESVTKRYDSVAALQGVDICVDAGRVHVVLGENGAGKSTLIGVLSGRIAPDEGRVAVDGQALRSGDPYDSRLRGIAVVAQDLLLVPSMTGIENVALGLGCAANRQLLASVREVQSDLGIDAPLDTPVDDLELPDRQRIAMVRALAQKPRYLLLDEPTSVLPPSATGPLLRQIERLSSSGLGVLLVTHRLAEARTVAERITILRGGRVVAEYRRGELPTDEELAMVVMGRTLAVRTSAKPTAPRIAEVDGLRAESIGVHRTAARGVLAVEGVSIALHPGEVCGLAGLDGNGQVELLEGLAGLRKMSIGKITYKGRDISGWSYRERRKELGIYYVSGDRKRHGIFPTLTIAEHFEQVHGRETAAQLGDLLGRFEVRPPIPRFRADSLSGGNQQKVILARALGYGSTVLLLAYPTQGLDVGAAADVRNLIVDEARRGAAVLVSSSDLDELLSFCDRIVVMKRGHIVGEQRRDQYERERLGSWMIEGRR